MLFAYIMSAIAGQTNGPNWLKFISEPMVPGTLGLHSAEKSI